MWGYDFEYCITITYNGSLLLTWKWMPNLWYINLLGIDNYTVLSLLFHQVFCAQCSQHAVPLPHYGIWKAVRVCNVCFLYYVTFTTDSTSTTSSWPPHHCWGSNQHSPWHLHWVQGFVMVIKVVGKRNTSASIYSLNEGKLTCNSQVAISFIGKNNEYSNTHFENDCCL